MGLKVYNTLSRSLEEFKPMEKGKVKIYVCGITPYDKSHIGHARPSVFWDVVRRYLTYLGYDVTLVQNFTDIEDKIIAKSKQLNVPPAEIAEKYSQEYLASMDRLGVLRADVYPRATQVIPEIIEMTETLIKKGFAYQSGGDVYFRADRFKGYGKLSGKDPSQLLPGARVSVSTMKESPLDWALWKSSPEDEPGWPSPWGRGRPGWHIECSVMVQKYLGPSIDMHGGGTELIFPHHENEIAQSEAYTGIEPYVRYWVHHDMLNLSGEKMSKSLGNTLALDEILSRYEPMAVRLYLLSAQHRKILEFSWDLLDSSMKAWERIENAFSKSYAVIRDAGKVNIEDPGAFLAQAETCKRRFFDAMDDDFNTPGALGAVFDLVSLLNAAGQAGSGNSGPGEREAFSRAFVMLGEFLGILGLAPSITASPAFDQDKSFLVNGLMDLILQIRENHRKEKDYRTADAIRSSLAALGVVLEDTPSGTRWHLSKEK